MIFYLAMGSDAQGGATRTNGFWPAFTRRECADLCGAERRARLRHRRRLDDEIDELSRKVADAAIRILNGDASRIKVPPQRPGQPVFDWRELRRWGIPESRLPANSVVLYRAPSLWQEYRGTVLTALGVMAIQFFLISGLLYSGAHDTAPSSRAGRTWRSPPTRAGAQTMSALTNSIAHELGQPLGSMIQNAHALQMMVTANRASSDTIDEVLSEIRTQGLHATQIIDRQRTMLRSHQLDKKPTDVHDVIKESLALVAPDMRARQVEAAVNLSPGPSVVSGDQVLLQQVLVNLMMNAIDAMSQTPPDRRRLTVSTDVRGANVDISVRDTGTGLPEDFDAKLFTPFVTTKSHGMGIGLTIVQTIVAAHGGTIGARNNPDRRRDIHRHTAAQRNSASGRRMTSGANTAQRPRVLLADDYPGMVKAVSRLLALDCDVVGSVADGGALLEAVERLQPDVIVLDVNLPKIHGLEACRQVMQANPRVKVVVFTATSRSGHQAAISRCRRIGICIQDRRRGLAVRRQTGQSRPALSGARLLGYAPAGGSRYSVIAKIK